MSYFLNFSNLTKEDFKEIKHIMSTFSIDFKQAMGKFMNENPGKIEVLGEMKNGEFVRDEIDEHGVREFKGRDGIRRMINHVMKKKKKN